MYLQVQFPSGRCYAAQSADPAKPEWPPDPSRLHSAIVASAYRSDSGPSDVKRAALEWFETLPPPSISFPDADQMSAPVTYVPPGDTSVQKIKCEHPVFRLRQPRHFPSAFILGDPTLIYQWEEDPDDEVLRVLDDIAADVTHVGTSHSFALVSVSAGKYSVQPNLKPDPYGNHFLRTPSPGRLKELNDIYDGQFGVRRPPSSFEPITAYRKIRRKKIDNEIPSNFDFHILRISGTMHGADTAGYLSRAYRAALMALIGDAAPVAVHGHGDDMHAGWLPLPDVGHQYAKGAIMGIGVAIPRHLNEEDRKRVFTGIKQLTDLRLPDGRTAKVFPLLPGERIPLALKINTWTDPSNAWSTVTPVVLDRPPKKLTEDRVAVALAQSLRFAGYPDPVDIEISSFSKFHGAPPAFRVPANKPRFHATVRFENPVEGPVMAGRLRFFGVGMFRPFKFESGQNGGAPNDL